MTSAPTFGTQNGFDVQDGARRVGGAEEPDQPQWLRLKPTAPITGRVDGAWWPRSRDLAAELPRLLDMLSDRLGSIERVSYHLGDWDPPARKISFKGRLVRLAGYHSQHADTVDVLAAGQQVTLLVVPPDASAQTARAVLAAAGHDGNADSVEALLKSGSSTG